MGRAPETDGKGGGKRRVAGAGGSKGAGQKGAGGRKMGLLRAIRQARQAALAFRRATGRPLGAAEGLGMAVAARLLGLTLAEPEAGFDAVDSAGRRLKLRVRGAGGELTGPLRLGPDTAEWDAMLLVTLNARYRPLTIVEADRAATTAAAAGKQRLAPAAFRKIAKTVWQAETPEE